MLAILSEVEGSRRETVKVSSTKPWRRCNSEPLVSEAHENNARHPERKRGTSRNPYSSRKLLFVIQSRAADVPRRLRELGDGMGTSELIDPATPEYDRNQQIVDALCHLRARPCPRAAF